MTNRTDYRTTICYEKTDDGAWRAYEPANDGDLSGRGETPHEAITNYVEAARAVVEGE